MPAPFGSYPFDASGVDLHAHPLFIMFNRAPTSNDIYNPGTRVQNNAVSPPAIYQTSGAGRWNSVTPLLATYDELVDGTAQPELLPSAIDVYTYVNSVIGSGARFGTGVLVAGTQMIADANITIGDCVIIGRTNVNNSTALGELTYKIDDGIGFTVNSVRVSNPDVVQPHDESSFFYMIVRPS